jgi:heme-degrading monooxygenase HmoA
VIAIFNSLPVKEGAANEIVDRFVESRGNVQGFPGFVSMEVLKSDAEDEVLVVTRWRDRESFETWVHSEEFRPRGALSVPRLTLTTTVARKRGEAMDFVHQNTRGCE